MRTEALIDKNIVKKVVDWSLFDFVIPSVFPLAFVWVVCFFLIRPVMDIHDLFVIPLENGVYLFVGVATTFGLLQDRKKAPNILNTLGFGIRLCILMFFVGLIFVSSLGLLPGWIAVSYQENINYSICITIAALALSIHTKYRILKNTNY
jgi:hypothetical protein